MTVDPPGLSILFLILYIDTPLSADFPVRKRSPPPPPPHAPPHHTPPPYLAAPPRHTTLLFPFPAISPRSPSPSTPPLHPSKSNIRLFSISSHTFRVYISDNSTWLSHLLVNIPNIRTIGCSIFWRFKGFAFIIFGYCNEVLVYQLTTLQ